MRRMLRALPMGRYRLYITALALAGLGALLLAQPATRAEDLLSPDPSGRVPAYLVLGMFPNFEGCRPSLPPLIDEAAAEPYSGMCQAGKVWQELRGFTTPCAATFPCSLVGVDLNCFFSGGQRASGIPDNVRGYTHVYVHSPTTRAAQIRYSSDDGSFILLNGVEVFNGRTTECHCYGHEHIVPVTLPAGKSRLLISIGEAAGHWGYNLRFTHPSGAAMTDLQFSLGDPVDQDDDQINDSCDNCPAVSNPDQADFDGDGAGDACDPDADNDGVEDSSDACSFTPAGGLVDAAGCTIEQHCPCESSWRNHGDYVSCVAQASNDFVRAGLITGAQKGALQSAAAQASCGQP